ncbi:MAG: GTPase RsgA [Oscillospiraceae bacterium]
MMNDRIIKALSGFYYVQTEDGVVECRARGKFRKEGVSPLVGDLVRIERSGKSGTVTEILPRKNSFIRPAVANVDLLVLLASCAIPQTEPFLIDRVLAIAGQQGVEPLICVNKNDLEPERGLPEFTGARAFVLL